MSMTNLNIRTSKLTSFIIRIDQKEYIWTKYNIIEVILQKFQIEDKMIMEFQYGKH